MSLSEQLRRDAERPAAPSAPPPPSRRRSPARVGALLLAMLAGALLLFIAARFLTEKQPRRSGTNSVFPGSVVATLPPGRHLCQVATVPAGTRVVEIPFDGGVFARHTVLELRDASGRPVTRVQPRAFRARATRYVLPRTLAHDVSGDICLVQTGAPTARVLGSLEKRGMAVNDLIVNGAISIAYYRPGSESLLSMIPVVAQRIGRTRGMLGGTWRPVVVVLLLAASLALAAWCWVGVASGRRRRVALLVAAVAGINTLAWGLLVPPLQIPDEMYHLSYVQDLSEHGKPPIGLKDGFSDELNVIVGGAAVGDINFNPVGRGHWSADAERQLGQILATKPSTNNRGASVNLKDYPPGYYATLVPTYVATHALGGSTLDGLTFMRALNSIWAIVTALALLAMLRELFPRRPLLTAGVALTCAYQPVFTWISSGVNPDGLLIALGALLFWLFARGYRRGLDVRLAIGIGLVLAASGLVKVSALGFLPGTVLGVLLLLWRRPAGGRLRPAIAAVLAAGLPVLAYMIVNRLVWDRALIPAGVDAAARGPGAGAHHASNFATYLWQYFLPRVGSMTDFFRVPWTPRDFWTPDFVGRFGWYDYVFPHVINAVAFWGFAIVAIAALVALVPRLRRGWLLAVIYGALAAGLLVAIARVGYPLRAGGNYLFEQTRYVLPLIAFYALALALALSLLRRRALVVVMSALTAVAALHLLGAFVLTVRRYYL